MLDYRLTEDIVISVILLLHKLTESAFSSGAQILQFGGDATILLFPATVDQELDTIGEIETKSLLQEHEVIVWVCKFDGFDLITLVILQISEDVEEHAIDEVHDLLIMRFKRHLEIQTDELGEMAMGVRVLGAENYH